MGHFNIAIDGPAGAGQDLENLSFKRSYMGDGKFLYKKMDGTKEVCVLVEPELGKETELNVSFDKAEEHGMRDRRKSTKRETKPIGNSRMRRNR